MTERVRVGFVGCGAHARRILYPSIRLTDLELVATSSLVEEEARSVARSFGAERFHVGHESMLEEAADLDALLVAVQPAAYAGVLSAALERGIPVWAEKPAAASAAEARARADEWRNGPSLCIGFQKRFAPAYDLAWRAVRRKRFGKPSVFTADFVMGSGYTDSDYSFLVDNSIHPVDLMRYFMGEVEALQAVRELRCEGRFSYGVLAQFARGGIGFLNLSTMGSWHSHNERLQIFGEGSKATVDNVVSYRLYEAEGPGESWEPNFTVPIDVNQTLSIAGYAVELQHFADVVRGRARPRATIDDAVRALEVIDEIYVAAGGVTDAV